MWKVLRGAVLALAALSALTACHSLGAKEAANPVRIESGGYTVSWPVSSVSSWKYTLRSNGEAIDIELPAFEIDGRTTPMVLRRLEAVGAPVRLRNGATEYVYEGALVADDTLHLEVKFRVAADNPVVRFRYALKASTAHALTKKAGEDSLVYLAYALPDHTSWKEIRLSVFNEMIHACHLVEAPVSESDFAHGVSLVGPLLVSSHGQSTFLCAYEHDSMYTDRFVAYRLQPKHEVALCAVKGNYVDGQPVEAYSSIWLEVAGARGSEEALAEQYRTFVWQYLSENRASRKPYLYYNTWGRQERVKWAGGQYLTTMNLEYTQREIDRAHEMGLEIYVLDAGWFDKTGAWNVNLKSFPDGFAQIRQRLERYGMQLGVWMDPAKAAISSEALRKHGDCVQTRNGKADPPAPEWETEDSVDLCLVSPYWSYYADVLIRLYRELGVRYFYLDGVRQTGCDDPHHFHGTEANRIEERQASYGFLLPIYLAKIIEKVSAACPDVIFDFDVTEANRIGVGLQFLASGRYFALNNGPYFHNFDLCARGESILANGCRNIFIQPGPARGWFMRSVLDYDRWIPSNLVMANYQSDDPARSQLLNVASLVLGQNAVWGEILKTSPQGVARFNDILARYKAVREDVAMAAPVRTGNPGDTPEIYEKINPRTGKGVVVLFANAKGTFHYVTRHVVAEASWHTEGVTLNRGHDGCAEITAEFAESSAQIVFFGVE